MVKKTAINIKKSVDKLVIIRDNMLVGDEILKVVAGYKKGQNICSLEGNKTRPTTQRVKEAVFSIIQMQIQERRFLDLYAGSGAMGIEALSRGAKQAVFVDNNRQAIDIIKKNLEYTKLLPKAEIVNDFAENFLLRGNAKFDIAYIDPPYKKGEIDKVLVNVCKIMNTGGIILCEHSRDEVVPDVAIDFYKVKTYSYGKISVSKYERQQDLGEI